MFVRDEQRLSLGDLLTVNNDEIRPSINIKDRGIRQTNITYAFTSNLVLHVFGELYFLQDIYTNTCIHIQKALFDAYLRKQITRTSGK